jgi:simple sugar transport system permease protein
MFPLLCGVIMSSVRRRLNALATPLLAIGLALGLGAVIITITSGSVTTVVIAYGGLWEGAFTKQRGLSESLVATVPYIFASLALAIGFKAGLFNIGVEGQFAIGSLCAAWAGVAFAGLPAVVHLPLALLAGALGGAGWAAIPGFLKAKTGAHEVINTIMMNYVAFRIVEFIVSGPFKDNRASAVQTPRVSTEAELWTMADVPARLANPLNALLVAILLALPMVWLAHRYLTPRLRAHINDNTPRIFGVMPAERLPLVVAWGSGLVAWGFWFIVLPATMRFWWPFTDEFDRLHIGILLAPIVAIAVWWLIEKTTLGFELKTVGANPEAAKYAGINLTRTIVLAMSLSGALAGVAGTIEVLGVSICRCLPIFFSAGYGFDSIAIALLARSDALGIIPAAFLFGALRNGADLMELRSGVSKYIISLIQALVLLFVAAPAIVRWLLRQKIEARAAEGAPLTRGWGS